MKFDWIKWHDEVKGKYLKIAPHLWWGDDLDVRFYLLKELQKHKNKTILDIGCNIGLSLSFLDISNQLYGIDIDDYCVTKAKELNPTANIYKGSMEKLPYEDKSMDIIVMMNVFPYYDFRISKEIKDSFVSNTFNEVYRVLKDDGILYLTTPNGESVYYKNENKVKISELEQSINKFKVIRRCGWNNLSLRFIPPRISSKFKFIWNKVVSDMDKNITNSKYIYLELKK